MAKQVTGTRSQINGIWNVDVLALDAEVKEALFGAGPVTNPFTWEQHNENITFTFDDDLAVDAIQLVEDTIAAHKVAHPSRALAARKTARCAEIDQRTKELFAEGYEHAGKTFSLSLESQSNLNGAAMNAAALPYPFTINTIDDTDEYAIADADDMLALYGAAFTRKSTLIAGDAALKSAVRAAADEAAVNAVVDDR